jgi:tRNA 2-(methylsulfanyl)-N6-isopentenyladenosine37 hydroxylase
MFQLHSDTPPEWIELVFADFDGFLADHALCERKASAMGMSLVAKYTDKIELLDPLIAFAAEELEHFRLMVRVLNERGIRLPPDEPDPYVTLLRRELRSAPETLLLDRLLVAGVIEARSCERLEKVTRALPEGDLKASYFELIRAEARHHALFHRLAELYYPTEMVRERSQQLFAVEAQIVATLPLRARVH